ncbi:hypothetical protein [Nocardia xishanensis]
MSRLEWTRFNGDDVEAVVSMFVCREREKAFRIRPSQGDGGIDVCVPISPGHVEIYQVKKFASNLESNEKRQIEKSHKRIQEYAKRRNWVVDNWYLTMPLDRTPENDEWFNELEDGGPFPCTWLGLTEVENWVSAHPDIVDYYLRDGKARLIEEVARFSAIAGLSLPGIPAVTPDQFAGLEPAMISQRLAALRTALNDRDPHFLYDVAIGREPVVPQSKAKGYPALAAVNSQWFGDTCVTFHIFARCAESLHERPIEFRGTLVAEAGSDAQREIEEFFRYGRTPSIPLEMRNLDANLPGGLGGRSDVVRVLIGQASGNGVEETFERIYAIISPGGESLAELEVSVSAAAISIDRKGLCNRGSDASGIFNIEILSLLNEDGTNDTTVRVNRGDVTGKFPDDAEQPLAFMQYFRSPNKLKIGSKRARRQHVLQDIPTGMRDEEAAQWNEFLLRYVRALRKIQDFSIEEIVIPDLDTEPRAQIEQVFRAARLLNGESIAVRWNTVQLSMFSALPETDGPFPVEFTEPYTIKIGSQNIELGSLRTSIESAQLTRIWDADEGVKVVELIPGGSSAVAQLSWHGETSLEAEGAEDLGVV